MTIISGAGLSIPYQQKALLSGIAVSVCTPPPSGKMPTTVPLIFNWSDYKNAAGSATPSAPVAVNLQGGITNPIDKIRSIKIDNLNCFSACTVTFPDTGDEVTCAANSTTMSNVLTGGLQATVLMDIQTGNLGTKTTIFFNNFMTDTADLDANTQVENFERATGSPNSLNVLNAPTIGDRFQQYYIDLSLIGVASRVAVFGNTASPPVAFPNNPPNGYNFIVLKECHFDVIGNYNPNAQQSFANMGIYDDLGAPTQFFAAWYPRSDIQDYHRKRLFSVLNTQQPINADVGLTTKRKYYLQNDVATIGFGILTCVFTLVNLTNF